MGVQAAAQSRDEMSASAAIITISELQAKMDKRMRPYRMLMSQQDKSDEARYRQALGVVVAIAERAAST